MGQGMSCGGAAHDHGLFSAAQFGESEMVMSALRDDPSLVCATTPHDRQSLLHVAAANGQTELVSMLLDRNMNTDLLNRHKQTPLMVAAMHGRTSCVEKLLDAGANVLVFDSLHGRTCLHYAAYYGHSECLKAILSSARTSRVATSWGYARFVNIRDGKGATPLHLAARQRWPECVHALLDSGALVCASTGGDGYPGSTPLHLAARGGSIDCIRELLARGADRLQRDASGRIPHLVALKYKHGACAALLNPAAAEPLVWPSPLKFINELNQEAKALLERAFMEAGKEREKSILKLTGFLLPSPSHSDSSMEDDISESSNAELCCICFEQACNIQVQNCGHQMCAHCTLSLCCHNKPNPTTSSLNPPVCPFCRSTIARLSVVEVRNKDEADNDVGDISPSISRKPRKSRNFSCSEGGSSSSSSSSSLKGLSALGKISGRGPGRIAADTECDDKP
ncbi:hypothetical protein MLD38_009644 [Melastoma candidum]|uniref:Uncharacterized protein n=1 Tax=Melastoma candidum TaxID=119954 RepID=A0ACB9RXV6_9MYRT|nr:hypothetical protein MLD38_009644 [Melastoma candidum]